MQNVHPVALRPARLPRGSNALRSLLLALLCLGGAAGAQIVNAMLRRGNKDRALQIAREMLAKRPGRWPRRWGRR